jgi:hypothetical protein
MSWKYTEGKRSKFNLKFCLNSLFWVMITWMCHSYRWWLLKVLHNYEHVITQQLISAMESPIGRIAYLNELSSAFCPHDEAAVFWRVAYCCWPMIHEICVFCPDSSSVIINHHMLNGNQLVQLRGLHLNLLMNYCASRPLTR